MEIFQHAFMARAFIVGIMLGIMIPCIGVIIVLKRLSMIGDALSHSSLAGVALGLILGINPVLAACIVCIMAALTIEAIRTKTRQYQEMSIAIVLSAGIGLAGLLSGYVASAANFNSFLFGSIVLVSNLELFLVVFTSIVVVASCFLLYKELFYIAFDERSARLAGVPVKKINFLFTILTAVSVSLAARTVGALIVSSMMVLPVACALQCAKSYKQTVWISIVFGIVFTVAGLFISFYARFKPGGTIVLLGVITFLLLAATNRRQ